MSNFMKIRALALKKLVRTLLDMVKLLACFLNVNHNKQACQKLGFIIYRYLLSYYA
jgi:hypothetical protein